MKNQPSLPKVFLIGSGNLAHALAYSLAKRNYPVSGWWARNKDAISLPERWNPNIIKSSTDNIPSETEIVLLAVSDMAIKEVSELIPEKPFLVCHCSGSVPADQLHKHENYGVFYPLQSFNKQVLPVWNEIPVFVEANSNDSLMKLCTLASALSPLCIPVNSGQRKKIHLSAVISSNFTNHLLYESSLLLKENGLDFNWLKALMEETVRKAFSTDNPSHTQTGPAKRKEKAILEEHLQLLNHKPDLQKIYQILTDSITAQTLKENEL